MKWLVKNQQFCLILGDKLGDWDWCIHSTKYKIDN